MKLPLPPTLSSAGAMLALLILMLGTTHAPGASAQDLGPQMRDVNAARQFNYCKWHRDNRSKQDVAVPDFAAVIENADGRSTGRQIAAAVLVGAGLNVAAGAGSPKQCAKVFSRGEKLYSKATRDAHRRFSGQAGYSKSSERAIANVQADLSAHWLDDQAARQVYIELQTDDANSEEYWARQRAASFATLVDARAAEYMRRLLRSYDWIDATRFGADVSKYAWTLVQHADRHPDLQALALERMQPYLEQGAIDSADYAHLWDRVAVNAGREQRYGTQPVWQCRSGQLELQPLEEPQNVNRRRRALGMESVESGLAKMTAEFCR